MKIKACSICNVEKPLDAFNADYRMKDGKQSECKQCHAKRQLEWRHRKGIMKPMNKNRNCPSFLGVHVAEQILSTVFSNVIRMPYGTRGYDFVCGKGFKVDVKSSCFCNNQNGWMFTFGNNTVADYFACIAFDNREFLNPLHLWIIPRFEIRGRKIVVVTISRLESFVKFEKSIDNIILACNTRRGDSIK
jgi:hypothetical protein